MADPWSLELEPPVLLPGRTSRATVTLRPGRNRNGRSVRAVLRCVEHWRYDTTESRMDADGRMSSHQVIRTGQDELHRRELPLAGATQLVAGTPQTWAFDVEVPELGPASFEADVLRCDWTLEVSVDIPMGLDEHQTWKVPVAQPMALLRAGVVATGQYGLFEEAPANVDAFPAQVRLDPVPIDLQAPFSGAFTVETPDPIEVQEVRLELRAMAQVTVSGGHREEIVVGRGRLATNGGVFGGAFGTHRFEADAPGAWLPSVDLPHGRGRGQFHVILARAWAPDIHYVRDVALATTSLL